MQTNKEGYNMDDRNTLLDFLRLPLASSTPVFAKFAESDGAWMRGTAPARFLYIPGTRKDRVLLVAHADTVWNGLSSAQALAADAELVEANGVVRRRNYGLGADNRAGCAIVWLLRDLGHSILITDGEEHGRRGSRYLMEHCRRTAWEINYRHQFAVQFDRCNGGEFKCYDVGTPEFRRHVQEQTGYTEPDRHSATDIVTLCDRVAGVNLSVGYREEHTEAEYLVLKDWHQTLEVARQWLSRPGLPRFPLPLPVPNGATRHEPCAA